MAKRATYHRPAELRRESAPPERLAFAAALKRLRMEAELSQTGLAELTGLSQTYISSLETGISNPTIETLHAIANVLEVDLGPLLPKPPRKRSRPT